MNEDKFADEDEKRYKVNAYWKAHPEELDRMNRENYENNKVTTQFQNLVMNVKLKITRF